MDTAAKAPVGGRATKGRASSRRIRIATYVDEEVVREIDAGLQRIDEGIAAHKRRMDDLLKLLAR